ncbi:anoctamin-4-like [Xenia sp. Carnegie-2017]|uniref:anoctamin-4-like n=1 Tax=Xenia sp. Carnegie-2017 TaxID=2897299 RepID=UPI001F040335|nr:anoctamin-4-like [Xenia sp. Carnegie-2017]
MLLVVVSILVGIAVYRASVPAALYANSSKDIREYAGALTSFTAACINFGIIKSLTFVYKKIAVYLTNWENPKTVSDYHNNLTLKMYVFEFVNKYFPLVNLAFFKTSLINGNPSKYNRINGGRIEECSAAGCLIDVCIYLFVFMTGKQILSLGNEFVVPCLKKRWRDRSRSLYKNKKIPQWEDDYWLEEEPEFRIFYEYLDMVIQFGFVTMFVASFPLAPLFALINNFVEIRADAINFVVNYRRRVSEQVKNIGIWLKIMEILTTISVVVNSFVIAFTTDFIPRFVYVHYYSESGSLEDYVNNSLSYIKISDLEKDSHPEDPYKNLNYTLPYCRFKEYLEPNEPYNFSKQYFTVMMSRFIFIVVFQYGIYVVRYFVRWLFPQVSSSLQTKIARKMHVTRMRFRKNVVETLGL